MECSDVHMHDEQILCDTESNRIKPDMSVCVCVHADERQGIRAVRCSAVRWVGVLGVFKSPTAILTSLYSQIYRPKTNGVRVRESTTNVSESASTSNSKKRKASNSV